MLSKDIKNDPLRMCEMTRTGLSAGYFSQNSQFFSFSASQIQSALLQDSADVLFAGMAALRTDQAGSHIPSLNLFKSLSDTSLSFESEY